MQLHSINSVDNNTSNSNNNNNCDDSIENSNNNNVDNNTSNINNNNIDNNAGNLNNNNSRNNQISYQGIASVGNQQYSTGPLVRQSEPSTYHAPNFQPLNQLYLPTITLPTFSGSFDSWLGFYNLFNSLIHEDESISPIRKLFYLKGCLTGEATDVVASIESSSQNYQVAWKLLQERYDDRKIIRESYIQSLIDTPVISKEFSTRSFVDHMQKHLRALQILGEPIESWDSFLVVLLRNKLNNFLRGRWEECSSSARKLLLSNF